MIRLLFLLPLLMCGIWWWYLKNNGYSVKDGLKGFSYILAFNTIVIGFFVMMIYVTHQ